MDKRRTAVVFGAADDLYVQHLGVAFVSLLVNLSKDWKARFYVAYSELSLQNRMSLTRTVVRHGGHIVFLPVNGGAFSDLYLKAGTHISHVSYYRLIMPDMLRFKHDVQALYLDCDVIVRGDVSRLVQTPLKGCPVGAVEDLGGGFRLADLNIPPDSAYFNAGVLLINLREWRERKLSAQVLEFLRNNRERLHYHDQDGLNAVLHGQWHPLHPRWNAQSNMLGKPDAAPERISLLREGARNPAIVHYTGKSKPWHYDNVHPYRNEYYRYLALTEWKSFKPRAGLEGVAKRWARLLLPESALSKLRKAMRILSGRSIFGGRYEG